MGKKNVPTEPQISKSESGSHSWLKQIRQIVDRLLCGMVPKRLQNALCAPNLMHTEPEKRNAFEKPFVGTLHLAERRPSMSHAVAEFSTFGVFAMVCSCRLAY